VIEAIDEFVLRSFYAAYRADGHGRAAHDPQMMLTPLVYAYVQAPQRPGTRDPGGSRTPDHRGRALQWTSGTDEVSVAERG
jgi:hypothetical protein